MIYRSAFLALAAMLLAMASGVGTASAQATRTWVSGVGDDANPCSRTAPCKTFAGAISKTAAGGEINCIDPGGFGGVTITKAITIACEEVEAGVLVSGTNGVVVNAGVNDVVILRGLDFEGLGTGLNGIRFIAGAALHVEDCKINGFAGSGNGSGILFAPAAAAELYVEKSYISDNGSGIVGTGIRIIPAAGGSVDAVISNSTIANNVAGIRADTSSTTGGINVTVVDSTIAGNNLQGIMAFSGTGAVNVMVDRTALSFNAGKGLRAEGALSRIRVGNSAITGNGEGTISVGGGQILSYGNNFIDGNAANGANPAVIPQK